MSHILQNASSVHAVNEQKYWCFLFLFLFLLFGWRPHMTPSTTFGNLLLPPPMPAVVAAALVPLLLLLLLPILSLDAAGNIGV